MMIKRNNLAAAASKIHEVMNMKRIILVVMALCLCLCGVGSAESLDVFNGFEIFPNEPVSIDLNNDGIDETISWHNVYSTYDDYCYAEAVVLNVASGSADGFSWSEGLFNVHVYAADLDEDGVYELLICGDEASDDYVTFCMHYTEYGLIPMLFADAGRGRNNEGYYSYGYGYIESIGEGALILCGSQDILGTRFGTRAYGLQDGRFELVDDGMWRFEYDYLEDPEIWEYAAMNPVMDISAMFLSDGDEYDGKILAGERFIITASDKESVVYFRMQDGRQGYFFVYPDEEAGWGCYIDGFYEMDVFEFVPYAD